MMQLSCIADIFQSILSGHQLKTLVALLAAVVIRVCVRSDVLGRFLAARFGIQAASGRNRWRRFLRNPRVTSTMLFEGMLRYFGTQMRVVPLAADWTDWPGGHRYLALSVAVGTRGIPIYARGISLPVKSGSQNQVENEVFDFVADVAQRVGVKVVILADRGFRRRSLNKRLQKRDLSFIVRLCGKTRITKMSRSLLLTDAVTKGRMKDLGRTGD